MEGMIGQSPVMDWQSHDLVSAWTTFKQHVDFIFSGPLKDKDEPTRCSYLMLWVGDKGRNIFSTWDMSADDKKILQKYYDKFEQYVKPRSNVIFNRYKFQCRVQQENESFEQFVTELQVLVKDCNFHDRDEMVRDRIVFGIRNSKIREKLINVGSELTLAKSLDVARSYEMSHAQAQSMSTAEGASVNVLKKTGPRKKVNFSKHKTVNVKKTDHSRSTGEDECSRCGYNKKHKTCPAMGKACKKCGKNDHFAKKCKTKRIHMLTEETDSDQYESDCVHDDLFLATLSQEMNVCNQLAALEWTETVKVNEMNITFQLDTGAMCNVISYEQVKNMNLSHQMKETKVPLKSFSGHKIHPKGKLVLPCKVKGQTYQQEFQVVDGDIKPILGAQACKEMELVARINNIIPSTGEENTIPEDINETYSELFKGLGCIPGTHRIKVDPQIPPVVHPPRKVPIALRAKVKQELKRMEKDGVIVKQEEPTPWVNSMVTVVKPNGKLRICIDPKDLNNAILREHFPMKSIEDIIAEIPDAKVFSKLDATSGFWQLRLDNDSAKLCTFNSPFGRYSFTRLPFGIKSAPEVYQRAISEMVQDLDGCEAVIDDILVWGTDMRQHDIRLQKVLDRIRSYNLKLSPNKCEFRKSKVTYVGHVLSAEGVKPDDEKVRAVREMERPTNKKELQSFLGFVQYLGKFIPNLSEVSAPLRLLTEKDCFWHWDKDQERSFQKLKTLVTEAPVLRYFDRKKELTLTVDASSKGLGAALLQEGQPIAFASRAMTATQQNYAQIEKETLAISFGCAKFHQYVYGRRIRVESDHKPLQSIFRKPLSKAPPRLQRLLLTLQKYDLNVVFQPGKYMFLADTLSRSFLKETTDDIEPDIAVNELLSYLPVSSEKYQIFKKETAQDSELQQLQDVVLNGWPEMKYDLPNSLHVYWPYRDEISCLDGLLFRSHKLIVPVTLRHEMLGLIHQSHMGIIRCKSMARETLFWPGMSKDIEQLVGTCSICAKYSNANPKEPLCETELPDRPWSIVSADLFEFKGYHYLVTVDHYSKWPEVAKLDNLGSSNTINLLKSQISRYGIPDHIITDNGPQFSSEEFRQFAKSYGFEHKTSSPRFPQSNGQAERTVQTVKNLLRKASDPHQAMLDYRNTVIDYLGLSPAEIFLGRRLKTALPVTLPLLKSIPNTKDVKKQLKLRQTVSKRNYDRHSSKELPPLHPGDTVIMENGKEWEPAKVVKSHVQPRSYIIQAENGREYRRNRRHLRKSKAKFPCKTEHDMDMDEEVIPDVSNHSDKGNGQLGTVPTSTTVPRDPNPIITTKSGRVVKRPKRFE